MPSRDHAAARNAQVPMLASLAVAVSATTAVAAPLPGPGDPTFDQRFDSSQADLDFVMQSLHTLLDDGTPLIAEAEDGSGTVIALYPGLENLTVDSVSATLPSFESFKAANQVDAATIYLGFDGVQLTTNSPARPFFIDIFGPGGADIYEFSSGSLVNDIRLTIDNTAIARNRGYRATVVDFSSGQALASITAIRLQTTSVGDDSFISVRIIDSADANADILLADQRNPLALAPDGDMPAQTGLFVGDFGTNGFEAEIGGVPRQVLGNRVRSGNVSADLFQGTLRLQAGAQVNEDRFFLILPFTFNDTDLRHPTTAQAARELLAASMFEALRHERRRRENPAPTALNAPQTNTSSGIRAP